MQNALKIFDYYSIFMYLDFQYFQIKYHITLSESNFHDALGFNLILIKNGNII